LPRTTQPSRHELKHTLTHDPQRELDSAIDQPVWRWQEVLVFHRKVAPATSMCSAYPGRALPSMIILGLVPLSLALILATQLVVAQVVGGLPAVLAGVAVGALIGAAWWLFPLPTKNDCAR
jgi:hypothetical protein